jgi:hypothetical protein
VASSNDHMRVAIIDLAKTLPGVLTQPPTASLRLVLILVVRSRATRARALCALAPRGFTAPRTLTQTCSAAAAPAHEANIQKPMFHTTAACARREPLPIPQRAHHDHV